MKRPFSESADAIFQVAAGLELWVGDCSDRDVGEGMAEEGAQVFGEGAESVVTALARGLVSGMDTLRRGGGRRRW